MEATVCVIERFNQLEQVVIDCAEELRIVVWVIFSSSAVTFLLPCKSFPEFYAWTFACTYRLGAWCK